MNISILPANFMRKIGNYVIETDEYTQGAGHDLQHFTSKSEIELTKGKAYSFLIEFKEE